MSQNHPVYRILVLDDDEIMRDLLEAMLAAEGFEVTLALDGEDATRLLDSGVAFDCILTDLQMPGVRSEALARSLRAVAPAEVLLLGMSGSEPDEATREALDGFLLKPFEIQLLRKVIQEGRGHPAAGGTGAEGTAAASLEGSADSAAVLDAQIFASLQRMISVEQLRQLFAMALQDIEKRHARIADALKNGNLAEARQEAHAIKGSCGMIGAAELQDLAAAIEGATTTTNISAVSEIPAACLRLRHVLESKLHSA